MPAWRSSADRTPAAIGVLHGAQRIDILLTPIDNRNEDEQALWHSDEAITLVIAAHTECGSDSLGRLFPAYKSRYSMAPFPIRLAVLSTSTSFSFT